MKRKSSSTDKPKSRIIDTTTSMYDLACADPFKFIGDLRGTDRASGDLDFDNMNKAAHLISGGDFDEQEIDIARTIREVVDSKILVPRDVRIDDSGIPVAANIVEWCTKDRFSMINGERPYIEQIIWGIIAFNEYCPNPKCTDLEYLYHDHSVSDTYTKLERKVCMLEHGVCPSCHKGRSYWTKKGKMNFYQELAVCAGQRSGKSLSVAGYFAPYLTHRLLKLQNPNAFYGLKTGTMLHCTFVALTYAQAKDTLWQNYYATLTESSWFKEYHSMLRFYEGRYGNKLLKFNDTYVAYPTRGLMAYPAGPDKRVLRGRTRFFAAVDEVAYFDANRDTKKVKDNAHEVVGALDRSLLTVRGAAESLLKIGYDDVYPGYAMNVSSPVSRNDMIMTLVRRAEGSKSAYGVVRPTWEVNPTLPRDGSTISEAYRTNPITAERDYGAVPPLASSPFIESENQIAASFGTKPNPVKIKRVVKRSKKRGESFTWGELLKVKGFKKPTIMALDAGYTNNSFAGAIGYTDGFNVIVKAVFEVIPEQGAPLNHAQIFEELLVPLMEKFNVRILLADRWNSIKLLQDAKLDVKGLDIAEQHSLKYKEMHSVKTRLQQGTLRIPEPERASIKDCLEFDDEHYPTCFLGQPVSHLVMQMATVKDTGKMVDKGDGYTDDTFRAVSLLTWACEVDEYLEILNAAPENTEVTRPTAFAVSSHGSGGGTSWGGGAGSGGSSNFVGGYLPGRR